VDEPTFREWQRWLKHHLWCGGARSIEHIVCGIVL
jgi:hypothetical protein